jgi:hypothetical protein
MYRANHYDTGASVDKDTMIALVRKAQRENDPRRRDGLWQVIREIGPVPGIVIEGETIGKEGVVPDDRR